MKLSHLIANAEQIPNIPKIVQELIESFNKDDADGDAISEKISKDQALTARVLRMANSAHYGGHRSVGSMSEAVVLLGFNSLRTLVLASGLAGSIKPPISINIKYFWHKSFMIGSFCKWLAEPTQFDEEVAFTCGMLHDIGGLLTHILDSEQAVAVDNLIEQGHPRVETEQDYLGFSYFEAGAELAKRWKFPLSIVNAIYYQETPSTDDGYQHYAGLIKIAKSLYEYGQEAELNPEDLMALGLNGDAIMVRLEETQGYADSIEAILKAS